MKTLTTKFSILLSVLVLLLAGTACNNEEDIERLLLYEVELNGANQVPSVTTTGSGTFTGTYNDETNILSYDINWELGDQSNATTAIRFHGPVTTSGANAPAIIEIADFDSGTDGSITGSTRPLTESEEADLKAGRWYISIYSDAFPDGELRGNIVR
ncbi:CHRD domain-containing protein [Pontibacter harenae]|uniref:CHRD domain-containing protein n=1 Tax=Pontibacter harenae TaxID=2894083 RepID=UPI001E289CA0|nr:CHRD domain-containing protein [Pontibacter harenae]MCC9168036.1 CHRD domain-containing protein [Pontibacter harenae]